MSKRHNDHQKIGDVLASFVENMMALRLILVLTLVM